MLRIVLFMTIFVVGGCASVKYNTSDKAEYLTPTASFHMHLAPFSSADVSMGSAIPVVGTTQRDGHTFRVVRLPDPSASLLNILVNDDGTFEGSAISALNGAMMGVSYRPEPSDVRLVPLNQMAPPRPIVRSETAPAAPDQSLTTDSSNATNIRRVPVNEWANVPCDIVVEERRGECEAEHEQIGIPRDVSAASQAANEPSAVSSCGYAGHGYRPIVDLDGIDASRYECDLSDCQGYASRINPVQNAAAGAVGGALIGAAIGALIGDRSSFARFGAGVGAVQGGVAGAAGSVAAQANVVRNCMVGRGYRVLQ
jgi:outer membrane lipoprotein SlyB